MRHESLRRLSVCRCARQLHALYFFVDCVLWGRTCYGDAARIIARAFLQPALPVTFLAQTMSSAGAATAFERRCRAHQVKLAAWLWATGSDDDENQQQLQLGATRAGVPRSATSGCPPSVPHCQQRQRSRTPPPIPGRQPRAAASPNCAGVTEPMHPEEDRSLQKCRSQVPNPFQIVAWQRPCESKAATRWRAAVEDTEMEIEQARLLGIQFHDPLRNISGEVVEARVITIARAARGWQSFYVGSTASPSWRWTGGWTWRSSSCGTSQSPSRVSMTGHRQKWACMYVIGAWPDHAAAEFEALAIRAGKRFGNRCANVADDARGLARRAFAFSYVYVCTRKALQLV